MMETVNLLLFVAEATGYFCFMVALLHFRYRLGFGVFMTALGVMHFLETYLAAVFYVVLPFGIASPGSSILFTGKLMMILILYIKEDAAIARQPIYGLFLGNLLTVGLSVIIRLHPSVAITAGAAPDIGFLNEMGGLMLWGTTLLYVDALGIILLYERLGKLLRRSVILRFLISGMVMLTFDQIGFFAVLHHMFGAPASVFWDGLKAKIFATALYTLLFALYQLWSHGHGHVLKNRPLADVFADLTFRERYEDLLARSGTDALTGAFNRSRMEIAAPQQVTDNLSRRQPASILIVDIDFFKDVNDQHGHMHGDEVLKHVARMLRQNLRPVDQFYRFGGEEFVVVAPDTGQDEAVQIAERLRRAVETSTTAPKNQALTVSIGVATGDRSTDSDGGDFDALLASADERLYRAKKTGRNRTCGRP